MIPENGREYIYDAAAYYLSESPAYKLLAQAKKTKSEIHFTNVIKKIEMLNPHIDQNDASDIFYHLVDKGCFIEHSDPFAVSYYEPSGLISDYLTTRKMIRILHTLRCSGMDPVGWNQLLKIFFQKN